MARKPRLLANERINGLSDLKFARLRVDGWRQFEDVEIDLKSRLTIITGANGAGKSTLLSFFIRHFGYNRSLLAIPSGKATGLSFLFGIFNRIQRTGIFGRDRQQPSPQIAEITYSNGVTSIVRIPAQQGLHYNLNVENQQPVSGIHIDSHRSPNIYRHVGQMPLVPPRLDAIGNGLDNEYRQYYSHGGASEGSLYHIKMAIIQMSIFGYGNPTMPAIPELKETLEAFEDKLTQVLPETLGFKGLIVRSPEILISTKSGDFLLDAASGGIIKLFEVTWQLFFFSLTNPYFTVTFDEPENHLHPAMQRTFLSKIMDAFPQANIIVVTHSPFIIGASKDSTVYALHYADTSFVEEGERVDDAVRGMMGSKVHSILLDNVNKAGTASEILREVLGLDSTIPTWASERVQYIVNKYKGQAVTESAIDSMYEEMEAEGLISSYPEAIASITRPRK